MIPIDEQSGPSGAVGLGDVQLAAKYRLLHQRDGGWTPDLAIFPRLFTPTAQHGLEAHHVSILLPIWAEKDVGAWQVFGGGGYQINPGPGQRDFWSGGLAITRDITRRLNLGAEIYAHTADADDARRFVGVNIGAAWRLTPHWSLLGAGGPGIENARAEGQYDFYLALKADY